MRLYQVETPTGKVLHDNVREGDDIYEQILSSLGRLNLKPGQTEKVRLSNMRVVVRRIDDGQFHGQKFEMPTTHMMNLGEATRAGYATFNDYPHLCIDIPDGGFTISAHTSEGKRITFSFVKYEENGPPKCVDIQHHDSGVRHPNNSSPVQELICFSPGNTSFRSSLDDEKQTTLATVLLRTKEEADAKNRTPA